MGFPKLLKLNAKGISHVIVPLVAVIGIGVVGTFAMVSSHAADKDKTEFAKAKTVKATSYLVVYSTDKAGQEKGYDQVRIKAVNVDTKTHSCGGSFKSDGTIVKKLTATKASKQQIAAGTVVKTPTKIKCSAIGGGSARYEVTFGTKAKGFTGDTVAVDNDAGYCSIIRTGSPTVKRLLKGSTCPTEGSENVLVKIPATVKIPENKTELKTKNGRITAGVAVIRENDPSFEATRILCTGSAKVEIVGSNSDATADKVLYTKNLPITFRGNADADKGHDRCVVSLKGLGYKVDTKDPNSGVANIRVTVDGSPYYSIPATQGLVTF